MTKAILPRVGAACGAVFAVVLFVAVGDGSHAFSGVRAVAGVSALTLAIPFVAYLSSLLREAEGPNGWLASAALACGITGITLKLASGVSELTMHRAHVADGTQLHKVLEELGGSATVLSLYPLAVFCAAVAAVALRTGVLSRPLGVGAAVTAVALAVNGAFLGVSFMPALLLFILWTLLTSISLVRRAGHEATPVVPAEATA